MSQVQQLLTEHIDIWTAADTGKKSGRGRASSNAGSVYGIKKLRELILELAVRGKLVPQDANDEPASELLKRIHTRKAQLIAEKIIKRDKPPVMPTEAECPFDAPNGWEWTKLGIVTKKLTDGSHNPPKDAGVGLPMLSSQNINYGKIGFDAPSRYVTEKDFELENSRTKIEENDVLLTIVGSLGRAAVVPLGAPKFVLQRSVAVIQTDLCPDFLCLQLGAPLCANYFEMHGKGTAQKGIYLGQLAEMPIAIPPMTEQHRIVAKVDELMALCDQLEAQHSNAADAHEQLVSHLLGTLTQSQDAFDFNTNWQRIATHFDTLFTTEASIDTLKQTLLQLAVMGKLVPQDPKDEPASELLKIIKNKKAKLISGKLYQKTGTLKPKEQLEKYPEHWEHVQTGDVCPSVVPSRDKPKSFSGNIPWITLPAFPTDEWYLNTDAVELRLSAEEAMQYSARVIPENSVLMSCIGRFGLTAINEIAVIPNQQIHAFIIIEGLVPEYLSIAIRVAGKQMEEMATSTTIAYLNKSNCESIEFGLPPLAEQHRIVAKVNELMTLCDQTKSRITDARLSQQKLADVLVEQALID